MFSCEFCEISKNTTIFTEHLRATASDLRPNNLLGWVETNSSNANDKTMHYFFK